MFLGLFVFEGVWWIHMVVCSLHPLFVCLWGSWALVHAAGTLGVGVDKQKVLWEL